MKKPNTKNKALLAALFFAGLLSLFNACDSRKDYLNDLEKSASKPPTLTIRRLGTLNPYVTTLNDTFMIGTTGYKLQYHVDGNYNPSSVSLSCLSSCDSVVSTAWHPDSSYFTIFTKANSTVLFQISCTNKFNQKSTAQLSITYKNAKPYVYIKTTASLGSYSGSFTDTCHYPASPVYTFLFNYTDDNSTFANMTVHKATSGDPAVVTVSNGTISLNYGTGYNQNKTYLYKIYGTDQQGTTGDTAYATVVCNNAAPKLYMYNYLNQQVTTINDSIKTTISSTYSLNLNIIDESATINNLTILKLTSGDNSTITKTGNQVKFDYSSSLLNKLYKYKMYITDPQGLVSDTCYFNVYAFKNRAPVFVGLASGGGLGANVQITSTQAPYYFSSGSYVATCTVAIPTSPAWVLPATCNINAYDPDSYSFGGFINKIKFIPSIAIGPCGGTGCYNAKQFDPTLVLTYTGSASTYALQSYFPTSSWYDPSICYGTYHLARYSIVLYDNNGDSTVVPVQGVQY